MAFCVPALSSAISVSKNGPVAPREVALEEAARVRAAVAFLLVRQAVTVRVVIRAVRTDGGIRIEPELDLAGVREAVAVGVIGIDGPSAGNEGEADPSVAVPPSGLVSTTLTTPARCRAIAVSVCAC